MKQDDAAQTKAAETAAPTPPSAQVPDFDYSTADDNRETGTAYDYLRAVIDNRPLSYGLLVVIFFLIMRITDLLALLILLFAGYVLCDRFKAVRRCVNIGGITWFSMWFAGNVALVGMGYYRLFDIDFMFTFAGFLLAVVLCGAFFTVRAAYFRGYAQGTADADAAIARHVVNRLVEQPDNWEDLDGDYLEVESALNRARDRERASEQALRDEAQRKDDLVTYLAHDLKTPLASVVGYLSLLEEAPDLPVEQRARFTGIALEKAHRLDALIEEFFDITRFDFHDIVLTRGYIDLDFMLAQVADEFYPTLSAQGKSAEISVPAGLTVLVDGDKMARVFNNVMKNAIAYSYEGSVIRVEAERGEGGVVIRFENQGDPIPAPKLKVIFEKFYRLDAARATNRGGAGLGLAIAKEIVAAHGGSITCESTPEKTVFTIVLPE